MGGLKPRRRICLLVFTSSCGGERAPGIVSSFYNAPHYGLKQLFKAEKKKTAIGNMAYASPMMIGFRSFTLDKERGIRGNFAVRNILTSFGNDLSLNLFAQHDKYKAVAVLHRYRNFSNSFYALKLEMLEYPVKLKRSGMTLSPRVIVGNQPEKQSFRTSNSSFFGFAGERASFFHGTRFMPDLDAEFKTAGWLAGNEFLNRQWSVKAGMSVRFY